MVNVFIMFNIKYNICMKHGIELNVKRPNITDRSKLGSENFSIKVLNMSKNKIK